jgi:hypothetical protein
MDKITGGNLIDFMSNELNLNSKIKKDLLNLYNKSLTVPDIKNIYTKDFRNLVFETKKGKMNLNLSDKHLSREINLFSEIFDNFNTVCLTICSQIDDINKFKKAYNLIINSAELLNALTELSNYWTHYEYIEKTNSIIFTIIKDETISFKLILCINNPQKFLFGYNQFISSIKSYKFIDYIS